MAEGAKTLPLSGRPRSALARPRRSAIVSAETHDAREARMESRRVAAVITGGASGLGRATPAHFVNAGGRVALLDRPASPGADVAKSLGPAAFFTPADVTSPEEVTAA